MIITAYLLVFSAGLIAGLIMCSLTQVMHAIEHLRFIDVIWRLLTTPISLQRIFSWQTEVSGAPLETREDRLRKVDPREQQISDTSQTVRSILLILAANIHRTDRAASESSQTLGDVRSSIDKMELPADLKEAHTLLMKEIDRVISSNSVLKGELAHSQEILAEQRRQIENLRTAVRIDSLTQLANRAYFDEKLTEMIRVHHRYDEPFSIMMIDIDNFKDVNDSFGHLAGDRILKGVALKIKATLRGSDFFARFGGDEFALILVKTGVEAATDVAWKLCEEVRASRFLLDDTVLSITLSVGVAEAYGDDTEETLLKRSDQALYRVKERGRDGVFVADKCGESCRDIYE
ncbi:MAG: GGDEF domain-containing protein [Desulfuromonadales bacterium]